MKLILHGQLADQFGAEFSFTTETVADAIEGLSRQLPDWPRELVIEAVGFATEEALRAPTEANEVHLIPAMYGGGGKFGAIVLGAAMIASAFIFPMSAALHAALIVSGATMAVTGVINLFMKAPSLSKSSDPDPSKYLSVNKNTTEIGTLIPNAWGRVQLGGQWLSVQSDSDNLVYGVFPGSPT